MTVQPLASRKPTAREARSACASVTWTSGPSGSASSAVTRASTAGLLHGDGAPLVVLVVDVDDDALERLPHPVLQHAGLDQVEDRRLVLVGPAAGVAASSRAATCSFSSTQAGTSVPAHSATQISPA